MTFVVRVINWVVPRCVAGASLCRAYGVRTWYGSHARCYPSTAVYGIYRCMALKRSKITIGPRKKYIQISHISFGCLHSLHYIYVHMKHLHEAKMNYFQHWWHATSCGIALLIHAWFPNVLENYASNKILKNERIKHI